MNKVLEILGGIIVVILITTIFPALVSWISNTIRNWWRRNYEDTIKMMQKSHKGGALTQFYVNCPVCKNSYELKDWKNVSKKTTKPIFKCPNCGSHINVDFDSLYDD